MSGALRNIQARIEAVWNNVFPDTAFAGDITGAHIVAWYQKLFDNATTFSSILASVMFSVTTSDLKSAQLPSTAREAAVHRQSAIGAILFVFLVLLCQGCSLLLAFHGRLVARAYDDKQIVFRLAIAVVSLAFQQLLLVGTLYFCLVLKSYVPSVGGTAFGITLALVILSFVLWFSAIIVELYSQARKRRQGAAPRFASAEEAEITAQKEDARAFTQDRGQHISPPEEVTAVMALLVDKLKESARIEAVRV